MGEKEKPLVLIIIVNWNRKDLMRKCLDSIKLNTGYENYKILVVDNGSNDGSVEMLSNEYKYVTLIKLKENVGFPKAVNIALKSFSADYYLLLNNDTEPQKGWLEELLKIGERYEEVGIIGSNLIYPDGKVQPNGIKFRPSLFVPEFSKFRIVKENESSNNTDFDFVDIVVGASFMIKRKILDEVGYLDEKFSPAYHEESDYCIRAKRKGYKVCIAKNSIVIHHEYGTARKLEKSYLYYISERNRIRFILLNFPFSWLFMRIPFEIICILHSFLTGKLKILLKAYAYNLREIDDTIKLRDERFAKAY